MWLNFYENNEVIGMKMKNLIAYIKRKQFYFALFACCVTLFLIAILVWVQPKEDNSEIANLNSDVLTNMDNPEELPSQLVDNDETEYVPEDEVEPDTMPTSATPITISEDEVDGEVSGEGDAGDDALVANSDTTKENYTIEIAPVVKPNITFTADEKMIWPVSGSVLMPYSMTPVHFKTLDQYKVNPAVYIASEVGGQVLVAAEGIVETVTKEPETGTTVTIYHGNGYKTVYGQLGEELAVKQGDLVKKGQVLGVVEKPTKYHVLLDSHVYFKVINNGESVNPSTVIE